MSSGPIAGVTTAAIACFIVGGCGASSDVWWTQPRSAIHP